MERCVASIRIIHEADPTTPEWEEAHKLLWQASHVVFLGFGYNPTNIERLKLDTLCSERHNRSPRDAKVLAGHGIHSSATVLGTCLNDTRSEVQHLIVPALKIASLSTMLNGQGLTVLGWLRNNNELLVRSKEGA
jgi:hypothetical protein